MDGLDSRLAPWAFALLGRARAPYTITSVRRSDAQQRRLYERYLRVGGLPAAPPGRSAHQFGLAWDMVAPDAELRRLGALWRRWGGVWGGERDPVHFEAGSRMLSRQPAVDLVG